MEKKLAVIVDNNEEITTGNDGTEMCSSGADVAVEMCSPESHDTCGDGMFTTSDELVEILCFSHFTSYMTFLPTGKKGRKKQRKSSIEVSVALHLVTGDTSDSL